MLEQHEHDPSIFHIGGRQLLPVAGIQTARFSLHAHVRGWATWRWAWQHHHPAMQGWTPGRQPRWFQRLHPRRDERAFYAAWFDSVTRPDPFTWDYQWLHAIWKEGGRCLSPPVNLVENIGFGRDATHTRRANPHLLVPLESLPLDFDPAAPPAAPCPRTARHLFLHALGRSAWKRRHHPWRRFRRGIRAWLRGSPPPTRTP